jgi:hypothetical protein
MLVCMPVRNRLVCVFLRLPYGRIPEDPICFFNMLVRFQDWLSNRGNGF